MPLSLVSITSSRSMPACTIFFSRFIFSFLNILLLFGTDVFSEDINSWVPNALAIVCIQPFAFAEIVVCLLIYLGIKISDKPYLVSFITTN